MGSIPGPDPLVLRAITWEQVRGEREAWRMRIHCTMALTFADGLRRTGFVDSPAR